ncbi:GTPase HflX [Bradymonas sediminis]|nr:GTPase HflX [Bradymonas sediminis]TDP77439.1 GTP-binding protein HflX [Bradymonas sediminis]
MTSKTHIPEVQQSKTYQALILAVQTPNKSDEDMARSCAELRLLANTLGIDVMGLETQRRASDSSTLIMGKGKLREVARLTGGPGVDGELAEELEEDDFEDDDLEEDDFGAFHANDEDADSDAISPGDINLILVDADLAPRQQRVLQAALGVEVMDRSAVILRIFEQRAQTRESRLEVEIARLRYEMPRLRDSNTGDDRHGGGGGISGRGGRGHSNLELARQHSRDRLSELRRELAEIQATESARREQRSDTFQAVLVGYTNAGKSTLMRGLTGSDVLVEDKLFATLGTTVRRIDPPTKPQILISDTVGFITNLPHELVASFRSTLDEARDAQLQIIVVDASDSQWKDQLRVTRETLASIDASEIPQQIVFNKIDRLDEDALKRLDLEIWSLGITDALKISGHSDAGLAELRASIIQAQEDAMSKATLLIPFKMGRIIGEMHENARIMEEKYTAEGTSVHFLALPRFIERWEGMLRP